MFFCGASRRRPYDVTEYVEDDWAHRPFATGYDSVNPSAILPKIGNMTARWSEPGRGSDSPLDCHSLPRLRFAYPCKESRCGPMPTLVPTRCCPMARHRRTPEDGRPYEVLRSVGADVGKRIATPVTSVTGSQWQRIGAKIPLNF